MPGSPNVNRMSTFVTHRQLLTLSGPPTVNYARKRHQLYECRPAWLAEAGVERHPVSPAPSHGTDPGPSTTWATCTAGLTGYPTLPADRSPHDALVLDNLAGHLTPAFVLWLFEHGIIPLYTPLGASWLTWPNRFSALLSAGVGRQHPRARRNHRMLSRHRGSPANAFHSQPAASPSHLIPRLRRFTHRPIGAQTVL